jgi:hypothetical protein
MSIKPDISKFHTLTTLKPYIGLAKGSAKVSDDGTIYFYCKADIDGDGSGPKTHDPTRQYDTNLHDANGKALDSTKVPWIVLPLVNKANTLQGAGVRLGDLAYIWRENSHGEVTHSCFAVYADLGPNSKLGEISIRAAELLGVPSNPNTGGIQTPCLNVLSFTDTAGFKATTEKDINEHGASLLEHFHHN